MQLVQYVISSEITKWEPRPLLYCLTDSYWVLDVFIPVSFHENNWLLLSTEGVSVTVLWTSYIFSFNTPVSSTREVLLLLSLYKCRRSGKLAWKPCSSEVVEWGFTFRQLDSAGQTLNLMFCHHGMFQGWIKGGRTCLLDSEPSRKENRNVFFLLSFLPLLPPSSVEGIQGESPFRLHLGAISHFSGILLHINPLYHVCKSTFYPDL